MIKELFQMIGKPINYNDDVSLWSKKYIWSMARLGSLKQLPRKEVLPYKREDGDVVYGTIDFPQELFNLFLIADDWSVWFNGDMPRGSPAFHLRSVGCFNNLISKVEFIYGVHSGITGLELEGFKIFKCKVPPVYSVDNLTDLLRSDEQKLTEFVLKYGELSSSEKDFIIKRGLDGTKRIKEKDSE